MAEREESDPFLVGDALVRTVGLPLQEVGDEVEVCGYNALGSGGRAGGEREEGESGLCFRRRDGV